MWQSEREISREWNDIIGSAKGSQIIEKYWSEVGKGKRADIYHKVRKRRGHIFFEWNKCLCEQHLNCDTLNFQMKLYTVPEHLHSIPDFSGIHVVRFVKLHAFTFLVPYYDVHYDFCGRTMLNSSLWLFFLLHDGCLANMCTNAVGSNPDKGSPKIFTKIQAENIILTRIY